VGVNALLSKSLGEGNQERANYTAGNGVTLACIATVLVMLFGAFGSKAYFDMMSDAPKTIAFGTSYISICCLLSLGIFMEVLGERLLQASGRTIYTMITQGTGAVVNIILDPLLIFGLGPFPQMGIAGAAVATVVGQWIAAILAVIFNLKFNPDVQFSFGYLKPKKDIIIPVLTVGVPSIIMTSIGSVMNIGINKILQGFTQYGEVPVNVFGIYFKLQSFFFMPLFGLNNATISIVAYNYGARKPERITGTIRLAITWSLCIMVVAIAIFQIFPAQLLGFFQASGDMLAIGVPAMRTLSLCFIVGGFTIVASAVFQALGKGVLSMSIAVFRQLLLVLPLSFLFSRIGGLDLVWWSFPIAEVLAGLLAGIYLWRTYQKVIRPLAEEGYKF
jgi:putative MATE family efflux protein